MEEEKGQETESLGRRSDGRSLLEGRVFDTRRKLKFLDRNLQTGCKTQGDRLTFFCQGVGLFNL
jgi:hypothetical protein